MDLAAAPHTKSKLHFFMRACMLLRSTHELALAHAPTTTIQWKKNHLGPRGYGPRKLDSGVRDSVFYYSHQPTDRWDGIGDRPVQPRTVMHGQFPTFSSMKRGLNHWLVTWWEHALYVPPGRQQTKAGGQLNAMSEPKSPVWTPPNFLPKRRRRRLAFYLSYSNKDYIWETTTTSFNFPALCHY